MSEEYKKIAESITDNIIFCTKEVKLCYFNRSELEQWLQTNRVPTIGELNQQAQSYCVKNRLK